MDSRKSLFENSSRRREEADYRTRLPKTSASSPRRLRASVIFRQALRRKDSVRTLPALTLTLSPEEREPGIIALGKARNDEYFPALKNFLHLPATAGGEGRGEGERFISLNSYG